jgi:hypothetical protein
MKLAFLATALAAAVATAPPPPALPLPSSPSSSPTTATAPAPAQAPIASPALAQPDASTSATVREVDRLARLAADDASRSAQETTVRNAPGRIDAEVGGLRRCVDASGASVFTDRACDSIAATDAPPEQPAPAHADARIISVRSCARSKSDLLDGVRNALAVHDVNRLADYYHWTGMDGTEGYRLMDRLETFAKRPFVDAQLVSSRAPRMMQDPDDSPGLLSRPFLAAPFNPAFSDALSEPSVAPTRPADLLRVDQMRSDKDAASQVTWFRLRSNAGCWWMQY